MAQDKKKYKNIENKKGLENKRSPINLTVTIPVKLGS